MKRLFVLLVFAGGLAACAAGSLGTSRAKSQPEAAPLWRATSTPSPLAPVSLVPGESRTVSLVGAASGPVRSIRSVSVDEGVGLSVEHSGSEGILLKAGLAGSGRGLVRAEVVVADGSVCTVMFPVTVEAYPLTEFSYRPAAGKSVSRVFVAGDFNGWSMNHDELAKGGDGVFRLSKPISPGTHSYKFIVDGQWTADPSNPRTDSSGYGNSVIEVKGEAEKTFEFQYISAAMPGSGPLGGFHAALPEGDLVVPESVTLILNNTLVPSSGYEWRRETNTLRLLRSPAAGAENYAVVLARSRSGRRGLGSARIDFASAPRSPRDEILYFAMTDRFLDGDPSNNPHIEHADLNPLANYWGGDWEGIRKKIEEGYFDRLGVSTIWISPPNRNTPKVEKESVPPGRYFTSYHGYWPISFEETNEAFGSMGDLKSLVDTAHAHGIAVLLDFVASHVHEDHPLYRQHPDWATPLMLPDGRRNIRLFDEFPLTTWFDTFLPTLDYEGHPELIPILVDNAEYWLHESGADGFRHDAVKHIPMPFWRALSRRLRGDFIAKEGRVILQVGETISGYDTVARFVGPDLLDGQFDFPGYFRMRDIVAWETGSMADLAGALGDAKRFYPPCGVMSPLLGNHDTGRFMAYAENDLKPGMSEKELLAVSPPTVKRPESYDKLRLAFAYLLTIPGAPMIYYGDEIGLTGGWDPDNRRPMPWENRGAEQEATFDAVARLAAARRESVALRRGEVEVLKVDAEHLVFARVAPEETVIVAMARKPRNAAMRVPLPSWWGSPSGLDPLLEQGSRATLSGSSVEIQAGRWSYGVWRVQWR